MLAISRAVAAVLLLQSGTSEDGITAYQQGHFGDALTKLSIAAKDRSNTKARLFLALTQAAMNDCKAALPALSEFAAKELPAGLAALKCYNAAGDEAKTFTLLSELKKRFPGDADVLYLDAKLHMKAFNEATFAMFQHAPSSYRVHQLSAEIFEAQNRYSDALPEYRKAIELNPAAPDLHFRLGRAILLESHSPEALGHAADEFREELKISPEDAACFFQLGQIAQAQGKTSEARPDFERALELSPHFVQALIALGKIQTQAKEYEKAIALFGKAVELEPANETAHYSLLTAYRNGGMLDKAKAEKAVLDKLQRPPEGEFNDFLKKLGERPPAQ